LQPGNFIGLLLSSLAKKKIVLSLVGLAHRNYKDTFIWCDLFDDDLIFPLHGSGEYVLKALEVFDASQGM
jgi:hypothetical protein